MYMCREVSMLYIYIFTRIDHLITYIYDKIVVALHILQQSILFFFLYIKKEKIFASHFYYIIKNHTFLEVFFIYL